MSSLLAFVPSSALEKPPTLEFGQYETSYLSLVFMIFFLSCYLLLLTKIELDDHIMEQDMEFGWRVVLGSIIGFLGAALGSIGGVGGGGIFVPMLTLIIGFDPKTSTAISKCKMTDLCY